MLSVPGPVLPGQSGALYAAAAPAAHFFDPGPHDAVRLLAVHRESNQLGSLVAADPMATAHQLAQPNSSCKPSQLCSRSWVWVSVL